MTKHVNPFRSLYCNHVHLHFAPMSKTITSSTYREVTVNLIIRK